MSEPRPVAVIVLAAGEGTRMKSRIPKVLHPLCGRSMLGHALAAAGELDPQRLVLVAGHGRDQVSAEAEGSRRASAWWYRSGSSAPVTRCAW